MSDVCFVCFRSDRCDVSRAASELAARKLVVECLGTEMMVRSQESPVFRIVYSAEPHVVLESAEIAEMNPFATARLPCDARFEIFIYDLDAALAEYNTLFLIQETLEEVTDGFVFNTWNMRFPGRACNPDN